MAPPNAPTPVAASPVNPLLANALEAIENGIEDYAGGKPGRVSSALRNLCAGVLLLLKEKLRQESPPGSNGALIFRKLVPSRVNGSIVMVGKGKATVDADEIHDRLVALGVKTDWDRVFKLRDLRNAVEHYHTNVPHAVVQQAIADTFVVVVEALEHLNLVPAQSLSPATWSLMQQETQTFKALESACLCSRKQVLDVPAVAEDTFLEDLTCPSCGSRLLKAHGRAYEDVELLCQACGQTNRLPSVMEATLEDKFAGSAYEAAKEGCEPPVQQCPHCFLTAFVIEHGVCFACGQELDYDSCKFCGSGLSVDEQLFDGLCSWCANRMSKDD